MIRVLQMKKYLNVKAITQTVNQLKIKIPNICMHTGSELQPFAFFSL